MKRRAEMEPAGQLPASPRVLAQALLDWYQSCKRDLPWRKQRDPYRIWLSEVMLQQTRVDTVIPYYERFLQQYPTLGDLAVAPVEDVLKLWEGLGYYSRARNLHRAVREVAARYGGQVPDSAAAMAALPGVGSYTVGAVLSIAYNRPLPAVDGNVLRVLSRLCAIDADIARAPVRRGFELLAQELIPPGQAGDLNQALMELGALVCTPAQPQCGKCPWQTQCRACAGGAPEAFPVRAKKSPPRDVDLTVAVVRDGEGRYLLVRRPPQGLLAGLWEFPGAERQDGEDWGAALRRLLAELFTAPDLVPGLEVARVRHTFSHLRWDLRAYLCTPAAASAAPPQLRPGREAAWATPDEIRRYPLSRAHQHVAEALRKQA